MHINLIKVDNKTIGWDLIPDTKEDKLILGSIRHLQFYGLDDEVIKYNGINTESIPNEGEYVTKIMYRQEKHKSIL